MPVVEQDLSSLTTSLQAARKAERRCRNGSKCAAATQAKVPSCRGGTKLSKSSEEQDRNRWALSSQGARKEAVDPRKLFGPL